MVNIITNNNNDNNNNDNNSNNNNQPSPSTKGMCALVLGVCLLQAVEHKEGEMKGKAELVANLIMNRINITVFYRSWDDLRHNPGLWKEFLLFLLLFVVCSEFFLPLRPLPLLPFPVPLSDFATASINAKRTQPTTTTTTTKRAITAFDHECVLLFEEVHGRCKETIMKLYSSGGVGGEEEELQHQDVRFVWLLVLVWF